MRTIRSSHGIADISVDLYRYYQEQVGRVLKTEDQNFIDERITAMTDRTFVGANGFLQRFGYPVPSSFRMLDSHGNNVDGKYAFVEVDQNGAQTWRPVDEWIDEHDGNYDALFVTPCNPKGMEVRPRKSFVIYPNDVHKSNEVLLASVGAPSSLRIVPPQGYFDRIMGRPSKFDGFDLLQIKSYSFPKYNSLNRI